MEGYQHGGDRERMRKRYRGTGNKKHDWQVQNRQGHVKNSIGNEEGKELICMTHGRELMWGGLMEEMGVPGGGGQLGKNGTTVIA